MPLRNVVWIALAYIGVSLGITYVASLLLAKCLRRKWMLARDLFVSMALAVVLWATLTQVDRPNPERVAIIQQVTVVAVLTVLYVFAKRPGQGVPQR